jgi:hypothetical protein
MNPSLYRNIILPLLVAIVLSLASSASGAVTRPGPEGKLLATTYSGGEYLKYDISWMGIIKAGELVMKIECLAPEKDRYLIKVTATSTGLLALLHPVKDDFEIEVQGRDRLPVRMLMNQKEGHRRNRKLTVYDQKDREVFYTKNKKQPETFTIEGPVHNEFSSFLIMRALPLRAGNALIVPTFADEKRHEVKVLVENGGSRQSILGRVKTMKVQPQLDFNGLYEKVGNPDIWLTADNKRIPVRIEAKIKIGSLTAELTEYHRKNAAETAEAPKPKTKNSQTDS